MDAMNEVTEVLYRVRADDVIVEINGSHRIGIPCFLTVFYRENGVRGGKCGNCVFSVCTLHVFDYKLPSRCCGVDHDYFSLRQK